MRLEAPTPMDKDLSRGARPESTGWNREHTTYICTDAVDVLVLKGTYRQYEDGSCSAGYVACANGIKYNKDDEYKRVQLFISGVEFDRDTSQVVRGSKDVEIVTLPSIVREVADSAFKHCGNLRTVNLSNGLEVIESYAFKESGLEKITLHRGLKEVALDVFSGCKNLTIYIEDDCEADLFSAAIPDSVIVGPLLDAMVGNIKIWDLRTQRDIVLPEGIKKICNYWFYRTNVKSVMVPASVKEIGNGAFCKCKKLKSVTFAEGSRLEKLGAACFSKSGLEKIVIPEGVAELQKASLENCKSLTEVLFEENSSLKRLGDGVFFACSSLKNINLPEGLESIWQFCFYKSGLEEILIPSSVTTIGGHAFGDCFGLKRVEFQPGSRLQTIGFCCFEQSGLEEFIAPPELKEIESSAFCDCNSLRRVVLNEGLEMLKSAACTSGVFERTSIEEMTLPSTLKEISSRTFKGSSNLRTIYVRSGCRADLSRLNRPSSAQIVWIGGEAGASREASQAE